MTGAEQRADVERGGAGTLRHPRALGWGSSPAFAWVLLLGPLLVACASAPPIMRIAGRSSCESRVREPPCGLRPGARAAPLVGVWRPLLPLATGSVEAPDYSIRIDACGVVALSLERSLSTLHATGCRSLPSSSGLVRMPAVFRDDQTLAFGECQPIGSATLGEHGETLRIADAATGTETVFRRVAPEALDERELMLLECPLGAVEGAPAWLVAESRRHRWSSTDDPCVRESVESGSSTCEGLRASALPSLSATSD